MKKKTSYLIISIVLVLSIVLDLVIKEIVQNYFEEGNKNIIVIPNFFEITYLKNTGAAFGMFGNSTIALTIVSIVFILLFVLYDVFFHGNNIWYSMGISFVVGGAIGNLIDRIFLGYVRDFISINLFTFVFNLADFFITIGVIMFAINLLISFIRETKEKKNNAMDNK